MIEVSALTVVIVLVLIGLVGGGAAAGIFIRLRRQPRGAAELTVTLPPAVEEYRPPPPTQGELVTAVILQAARAQWEKEQNTKLVFDSGQRGKATHQRALRMLHAASLPCPGDLQKRVLEALADTKGIPSA